MKPLAWKRLSPQARAESLRRPAQLAQSSTAATVAKIIRDVRREGDAAVRRLTARFDGSARSSLRISAAEIAVAGKALAPSDRAALRTAFANIRRFHAAQKPAPIRVETMPGILCEKVARPIERIGLYVPGGSAPLFSTALMLGVPSLLARNPVRVLCTPPNRDGTISPWILYAAALCGISDVFAIGGAQAIAAMAFGTKTVPKCDKLFGPGNAFVTEAKLQVSRDGNGAAIDLPAGPSEVMVIADDAASVEFVASDLLSQAEHGPDSQVVLVCRSAKFAANVLAGLERQLAALPRSAIARRALVHSRIYVVDSVDDAIDIANRYAPEHLILQTKNAAALVGRILSAGSVFVGAWTPESLGDYASGTNHVLPTYGWARACSGLGVGDFMRTMTIQSATPDGLRRLGPVVERLASAENLAAHRNAVSVRLASLSP